MKEKKLELAIMSLPEYSKNFSIISCSFIKIVSTSSPITLPAGHQDQHRHFEFLVPLSPIPQLFVEDKEIDCHPGHLIPINPGQLHGVRRGRRHVSFVLIFFEQARMNAIIRQVYGNVCPIFPCDSFLLRNEVQELITDLIHEKKEGKTGSDLMIENIAEQLALMMVRHYYSPNLSSVLIRPDLLSEEQVRFHSAICHIHDKFGNHITIETLADMSDMNAFHFIRSFKKNFNISPYNYLTQIRLSNAKKLLTHTNLQTAEVGRQCGFQSASRFSAVFVKDTGMTPTQYRKNISEQKNQQRVLSPSNFK